LRGKFQGDLDRHKFWLVFRLVKSKFRYKDDDEPARGAHQISLKPDSGLKGKTVSRFRVVEKHLSEISALNAWWMIVDHERLSAH